MKEPKGWNEKFSEIYGLEWEPLKASLSRPTHHHSRTSFWGNNDDLKTHYYMDQASILAAQTLVSTLDLNHSLEVADFCAAPGGKSLILAEALFEHSNLDHHLLLNDRSRTRVARLQTVLKEYTPTTVRDQIEVRNWDASRIGEHHPERFDAILADVPCSAERHLMETPKQLATWTPSRSKTLAQRQYAILVSAWNALKPGGSLLYCTCSISPEENDLVIERLLKKKEIPRILEIGSKESTKTQFGVHLLPHRSQMGPLYMSLIRKEASQ